MKELYDHKEEIKEAYEMAENTEFSERYEKEIVINENLTVVVEKFMDVENPSILLAFSESYFEFTGYRTDFQELCPAIWGIFEEMFDDMFYYCEKTEYDSRYYWTVE